MGDSPRTGRASRPLAPLDDLQLALVTSSSFQASIQHADSKAAILLSVPAAAAAAVASDARTARVAWHGAAPVRAVAVALAVALVVGLAGALWLLARCLRPRLAGPPGANRFSFPSLAVGQVPAPASVAGLRDEAWQLVSVLADIAMRKHRALNASMVWLAVSTVAAAGWLALTSAIA